MNRQQTFSFLQWAYKHFTKLTLYNEAVLPKEGPFIIALNHMSRIDFPTMLGIERHNELTALVADKYQKYPLFKIIIDGAEMIWIDRSKADFTAMRAALKILKNGHILVISPEGTRSKTGQLIEAKTGVVLLASKAHVPICTMSITGTESFMDAFRHFRKPVLASRFGPPFMLPAIDPDNRDISLQKATDEVMCHIAAMLPKKYWGYYKDNPRIPELREEWKKNPDLQLPED